jgi:hypothetical protein
MDSLMETILTDEFANTLNIRNLLDNPTEVSRNMVKVDLASTRELSQHTAGTGGIGTGIAGTGGTGAGGTGMAGDGTGSGGGTRIAGAGGTGAGGDGVAGAGTGSGGGTGIAGTGGTGAGGDGVEGTETGSGSSIGAGGDGMPGNGTEAGGRPAMTGGVGASSQTVARHGGRPAAAGSGRDPNTAISPAKSSSSNPMSMSGTIADGIKTGAHGHMLLHQLDLMQQEVRKQLEGGGDISIEALADAVFEMKKQLFEEIQTQKALGIAYANEEAIVDNLNELTDQVLLSLIQEEYNDGKITTQRLAQIIMRLIPDAKDLKRLMPQIRQVLLDAGMSPDDYLALVDELKRSFENDDLARIIAESAEAIGVDSDDIIEELKDDSGQAAKLIYLASEIRKGGGDESTLADILVDYVEKMTNEAAEGGEGGETHLKKVISDVESTVLGQLSKMNIEQDVLMRMEERINDRMESILDRMRAEWLRNQAGSGQQKKAKPLTVLQTIEHNIGDDESMAEILKAVRAKVEEGEIEENNFSEIQLEIDRQKNLLAAQAEDQEKPEGVLSPRELIFILEKEIARANRYQAPFSALAFSFISIKPKMKALEDLISEEAVMNAALDKMVGTIREVDYVGQSGKNKMVALLPMQARAEAKLALGRIMNLLNNAPLMVNEIPVNIRVAGVFAEFNQDDTPTAQAFAKTLTNQLADMVYRLKNIQVLF